MFVSIKLFRISAFIKNKGECQKDSNNYVKELHNYDACDRFILGCKESNADLWAYHPQHISCI